MNDRFLITGATSGLGRAFYENLRNTKEADFLISGRNREILRKIAGVRTEIYACDLAVDQERRAFLTRIREWKPQTAIICAGRGYIGWFSDMTADEREALEELNIRAFTELLHTLCSLMTDGGKILVVSSIGALLPGGPVQAMYYAQKAFQQSLTDGLSVEYPKIQFSCLCPGPLDTAFHERAGGHPLQRSMSPDTCVHKAMSGFQHGRRLIVPGLQNKVVYAVARIFPRQWMLRMVYHQIRKKKEGGKT